ncbi:MAG: Do family serine endopeptidase [Cryomorphaceae bacterium]|nr:Do family serine endopeptidase [Cryomorphaceae bacterium]
MKKSLYVVLTALLTGIVTLVGYKYFFEEPQVTIIKEEPLSNVARLTANLPEASFDFVGAAEFALPTVVHVKTAIQRQRRPMNPLEELFFGPRGHQQPQIQMGTGSGVIVSSDGYIVTNNHVIAEASEIEVVLHDGREMKAQVVGTDPTTDIALIKIDQDKLQPAVFANSDDIRVGEWVLAVGNPFNLTNTVTHGIVSAKGRSINIINEETAIEAFIQTDAAVNPGNSGGALVNTKGELVGINTAISSRSGSFIGYSFAVPTNIVQKVMEDLLEFGVVQRAFMGVHISDLTPAKARELKIENRRGAYVSSVSEGGAAEKAGIKEGDLILEVDGREVTNSSRLREIIGRKRPGDEALVTVVREGKNHNFKMVLRNQDGTTDLVEKDLITSSLGLGATFEPLSKDERKQLNLANGLKIESISSGKLMRAGIPKGFIITRVDRRPVSTVEELTSILGKFEPGQAVLIEGVYPDGRKGYFAFGW